jgi:hypothetical protein
MKNPTKESWHPGEIFLVSMEMFFYEFLLFNIASLYDGCDDDISLGHEILP